MKPYPLLGRAVRLLLALSLSLALPAQQSDEISYNAAYARPLSIDRGSAGLSQTLQKLHTRASIAAIVAHPDDEDGGALATMSRGFGADTILLTLTRGEGGQNDMTSDYWDELGTLRTEELLAADNYYGAQQYFTRVTDFGFSKTMEEALNTWGEQRVLYDVVRIIRMTRPLVITATFIGSVSDGHGQHQVSGYAAQMAYKLAGDPNVFPDQIKAGLRPWSPLKVYGRVPFARVTQRGIYDYATGHYAPPIFRNYATGQSMNGVPSATLEVQTGIYNPLLGESYLQIARQGLNEQKSQNGGIATPFPRASATPYHLYAARFETSEKENSFFDGIDVSLMGIASYAPSAAQGPWRQRLNSLNTTVEKALQNFNAKEPSAIAPMLALGLEQTNSLLADIAKSSLPSDARYNMIHELSIKQQQFNTALEQALGLTLLANVGDGSSGRSAFGDFSLQTPTSETAIPGQHVVVGVHIANQGREEVSLTAVNLVSQAGPGFSISARGNVDGSVASGDVKDQTFDVTVSPQAELTKPYFSRPSLEQSYYDINDPRFLGLPTRTYPLLARATVSYRGVSFTLDGVVQTVQHVNGIGPVLRPLLVVPAVSLLVSPQAGIVPLNDGGFDLNIKLQSSVNGPAKGTVQLELPMGWHSTPAVADFATTREGEDQSLSFHVLPSTVEKKPYTITAVANFNNSRYAEGYKIVGYPGLRPYPHYRAATFRATGVDVKTATGLKVAYVMGTGDDVTTSLTYLGVHPTLLSAQDVMSGNLSQYDAIVLGIRAYASRPELKTSNSRLLEYVHNGGTLIVQYQTPEYDHNYGPYPLTLSGDPEKVVEENCKVQILLPSDPVLNWPNTITPADFNGWVEERGHGFMSQWDSHFIAPTEMHDAGQDPQKGGLLYARYGKGYYVYMAYAFFRQMPEGVPGSFRIMANLLSMSKNPDLNTLK